MPIAITQETFASIGSRWEAFLPQAKNSNIFVTPAWQKLWWGGFGAGQELLLYSLSEGQELVAVAPLMRRDGELSFVGGSNICDYMDFVVKKGAEAPVYRALASHLTAQQWSTLSLKGVAADSPTLTYIPDLLKEQGLTTTIRPEDVCPKVQLPSSWDAYLEMLSKKDRHELRRKERRLYNAGDYRYYAVDGTNTFPAHLEEFLTLLVNSRTDKARFMNEEMRAFFQLAIPCLAELGLVKLYFLEVGGKRVSSAICFDYSDAYYLYNSGYDTAYSSLSVGLLLKAWCLRQAIEAGKKEFNFLRGSEVYKYHLGAKDEPVYTITATR